MKEMTTDIWTDRQTGRQRQTDRQGARWKDRQTGNKGEQLKR